MPATRSTNNRVQIPGVKLTRGGAIGEGEGDQPNSNGVVTYLDLGEDRAIPLSKVEAAASKTIPEKLKPALTANSALSQSSSTQGATGLGFVQICGKMGM
jgi:hypothetical protein